MLKSLLFTRSKLGFTLDRVSLMSLTDTMVPYLFCIRLALSCSHEKKPRLGKPGELGTVTFFDSTVQSNDTKMRGADLFSRIS